MRTLIIATGLAALAALPASAQTGGSRTTTANTNTANATSTATTSTTSNATTASSPFNVQALPSGSGGTGTSDVGATTNVTTDLAALANTQPAFGPGGAFSNDSGNRALGQSVGQTSSGTLVGNSSPGIVNAGVPVETGLVGGLVPEGTVSIIGGGSTGFAGSVVQQQPAPAAPTQTPLFDQVAREGLAKEQRRRARGEEPRIIGIAPRTEADLSWQMPDDRIIRY
jgi:hypothetical protein